MRILKVKAERRRRAVAEPGADIYDEMGNSLPSCGEASEQEVLADAVQDTDALIEALVDSELGELEAGLG